MKDITTKELKERFTLKQLQTYNSEIRSKYNEMIFNYKKLEKQFEARVKTDVKKRTKELEKNYNDQLKEKDKLIDEKDKQIDALKEKIARMESKMNNDASNSGLPTSKTAIGKKKYIPNSRVKTERPKGRKEGHKKNRLKPFSEEEITETVEIIPTECNKCHSTNLEKLETSVDKQELDYVVTVVKRKNKFVNCRCKNCGNEFHANIPNDLKEPIQYGKTVQSLAVCLTNEIYTPFNKTVKLVDGITKGEIHMSDGYVTKLQKRASKFLEGFIEEVKEHIPKQEVYGWDDGVVSINQKQAILRTYCTDNVALFIGHENKKEKSLDNDGILSNTGEDTIVMHDYILHNYNEKYNFDNVECVRHLIRRLQKKKEETGKGKNKIKIKQLEITLKKKKKNLLRI